MVLASYSCLTGEAGLCKRSCIWGNHSKRFEASRFEFRFDSRFNFCFDRLKTIWTAWTAKLVGG